MPVLQRLHRSLQKQTAANLIAAVQFVNNLVTLGP